MPLATLRDVLPAANREGRAVIRIPGGRHPRVGHHPRGGYHPRVGYHPCIAASGYGMDEFTIPGIKDMMAKFK